MSNGLSPIEKWARETARTLVTLYLAEAGDDADDVSLENMISDLLDECSKERLGELVLVLIAVVGDTFEDLQDFSQTIIRLLGGTPE